MKKPFYLSVHYFEGPGRFMPHLADCEWERLLSFRFPFLVDLSRGVSFGCEFPPGGLNSASIFHIVHVQFLSEGAGMVWGVGSSLHSGIEFWRSRTGKGSSGGGRRRWCRTILLFELGSYSLFLQEQIKDIIIISLHCRYSAQTDAALTVFFVSVTGFRDSTRVRSLFYKVTPWAPTTPKSHATYNT